MKPLHLSMPHLVVMVGIPGSGKSFFADHFASTFGAPIVSSRTIRTTLVQTPTFSVSEQAAVRRVSHYMLDEILKTGQTFVYDSISDARTDRQEIVRKAKAAGYNVLFVWVQTDSVTARFRATKPSKDKVGFLTDGQFTHFMKHFTVPAAQEKPIVISGKHTYASQLKIVLSRLVVAPAPQTTLPIQDVQVRRRLIR
jgi:predicted kinase